MGDTWKELRNPDCTACPLHEEAQCVCLIGRGPAPTDVMIIGEAPGFREDEIGKPFSGKSGKLLDQYLADNQMSRDQVYITNICKCRPPENRAPTKKEITACLPYLWAEIEMVKPHYILLLGNTPLQALLKKTGIKKHHGNWMTVGDIQVMVTYHPAAVLRTPTYEASLKSDITRFFQMVRGEIPEETVIPYTYIKRKDQLLECLSEVKKAKAVSYDIETDGDTILCLGLYFTRQDKTEYGYWLPLGHPDSPHQKNWQKWLKAFKPMVEKRNGYKAETVGQNGKFDNRHIARVTGAIPYLDFDTMLASHILDENNPHGLDYLTQTYCNAPNYKGLVDKRNLANTPIKEVEIYNMQDAYWTLQLAKTLKKKIHHDMRLKTIFYEITMPMARALERAESRGMYFDRQEIEHMKTVAEQKMKKADKAMKKAAKLPTDYIINWNSPKQLAVLLFQHLGLEIIQRTKTGAPSTAEGVLVYLEHPIILHLLEYRKWHTLYSTFLRPWAEKLDQNDRLHTSYKIHGTVTGRLSSEKPNLQNVPRDESIRGIIGAPPGWKFIEADYSQIELRIAAHMSADPHMTRIFRMGGDIHTETACMVTGKIPSQITKEERKRAKAVNFGFLYGMGWRKFKQYAKEKYAAEFTDKEAQGARRAFFRKYSSLPSWHARQRRIAHELGYVRSILGRKRRLPEIYSTEEGTVAEAERQAINSPVQSVPPDFSGLAINRLSQLPGFWEEIYWVGQIHDALAFECRGDMVEKWCPLIQDAMINLPLDDLFNIEVSVPIEVEVKVGDRWGQGTVWKEGEKNENPKFGGVRPKSKAI